MTTRIKQLIGKLLAIVSAGVASGVVLLQQANDTLSAVIVAVSAITAALSTSPIQQSAKKDEKQKKR